jgi:Haem-binding domain
VILGVVIVVALVIMSVQAAAKNRSNPTVIAEPQWDSPETRQLAQRACCHSNQSKWTLYSGLPVVGRLLEKHVIDARKKLNFSEWGTGRKQEGEEAAEKSLTPCTMPKMTLFPNLLIVCFTLKCV